MCYSLSNQYSHHNAANRRKVELDIRDILDEIGLACSMPVIRWSGICLNQILQRICTAVHVNDASMQQLKRTIGDRPVLYLPSHRSYLDFVLMSYVCFAYDLAIPGIAAGMDFHGMAGIGRLIRMTCAFFMRRTFTADTLYWRVFEQYMHQLVTVYHTGVEFFIEGTRSRSFKALPPKIGLLSMALQPMFAGEVPDITIVPIGIGYDRPLEEQLFAYEMLGVPKPKETTMALFKAMRILEINHGAMYINFGAPFSARKYFGRQLDRFAHAPLPAHVQRLSRGEMEMCAGIARHIVIEQQRLIVLTAFNVLAVVFSYRTFARRSVRVRPLARCVAQLARLLGDLGALVAVDATGDPLAAVAEALRVHGNLFGVPTTADDEGHADGEPLELLRPELPTVTATAASARSLRAHQLAVGTLRNAVPVLTLQIYANPCMFWLAPPAFVLLAVRTLVAEHAALADRRRPLQLGAVAEVCAHMRRLFGEEFVLPSEPDGHEQIVDTLVAWRMLDGATLRVRGDGAGDEDDGTVDANVQLVLSAIVPFVCCYRLVAQTLCEDFGEGRTFGERVLLVKVQQRVEAALAAGRAYVHPYCLSLDSVAHAVRSFEANGYLRKIRR